MKYCDQCRASYPNEFNVCPIDNSPLRLTSELFPGITIRDKYLILDKVGDGGMGAVYRARHLAFNEIRALKIVHAGLMEDRGFIKRFRTEAIVARKLQHPNAVRIDDLDLTEDGRPFIVMEMVEGGNLKSLIGRVGVLPVARAVGITVQTAEALAAAHRLGIVHRDIKPDNILVSSAPDGGDLVKVADFGIAKVQEGGIDVGSGYTATRSGMIVGTPQYLSPEQAMGMHGDQIDGRADLYSLGIVLYVMLTGQLPFESDTPMGFLMHHVQTKPVAPHVIRPDLQIPRAMSALLMKALEKDRDQRFGSADEMAHALRQLQPASQTVVYAAGSPVASKGFYSSPQNSPYHGTPAQGASARPMPTPPRAQFAEAPGSGSLQQSLPASGKRLGVRVAIWGSATAVVVAAIFALVYVSGPWSHSRRPNPTNPNTEAVGSPALPEGTISPQSAPSSSSEIKAPKSTSPVEPESKPPAAEPEATTSPERQIKKKPTPAKTAAPSSAELPRKSEGPDVKGLISAGNQASENGEYDKAITSFQEAVRADPSNAAAQSGLRRAQQAKQTEEQVLQQH